MALLWITVLIAHSPVFAAADSLKLGLSAVDADHIAVTLRNDSTESVDILLWGSPFESELTQNLFNIRAVGASDRAEFRGRLIKRIGPAPEDFLTLAAGGSVEAVVPVVRYYQLSNFGDYTVGAEWALQYLADSGELLSMTLTVSPIVVSLLPQPDVRAAVDPGFTSCAADQQSTIQLAVDAAEQMTLEARDGLASLSEDARLNSPRYRQWFGAYDESRFDLVLGTYENLAAVLATESIQFNCGCDENGFFAFVFPSQPFDVYLCPAFWRASLTGRDSKAGTILHELTHFPAIQGTDDFAYAIETVALAIENPDRAVRNADNYEYFAENVPKLDIFSGVVFTELEPDVEVSGQLSGGLSSFYKVTGAEIVELNSDAGNADLVIYETAANDVVLCNASTAASDQCEVDSAATVYISVTAMEDSNYRLIARTEPVVGVQTGDPADTAEPADPVSDSGSDDSTDGSEPVEVGLGAFNVWLLLVMLLCRAPGLVNKQKLRR